MEDFNSVYIWGMLTPIFHNYPANAAHRIETSPDWYPNSPHPILHYRPELLYVWKEKPTIMQVLKVNV